MADVLSWKAERDRELERKKARRPEAGGGELDPNSLSLIDRNLLLDARLKEERLKAYRAKAMPLQDVARLLVHRVAALRKTAFALPRRLAPRCEGKKPTEIRRLWEDALEQLFADYAADVEEDEA